MQLIPWQTPTFEKPLTITPLLKSERSILSVSLQPGEEMKDHQTPLEALIVVRKGEVVFEAGDQRLILTSNDCLHIHPNEMHRVEAVTATEFLLIR